MPKTTLKLPLLDNPTAPDIFADEAIGYFLVNNTMRITLVSAKCDHTADPGRNNRIVVGRLVMPIAAVESFHKLLGMVLNNVKSQGQVSDMGNHTLQ